MSEVGAPACGSSQSVRNEFETKSNWVSVVGDVRIVRQLVDDVKELR